VEDRLIARAEGFATNEGARRLRVVAERDNEPS
jgi:hypothetical protein